MRKAFYQAIDVQAITTRIMRGLATPSALMISPLLFSRAGEFERWPYDPEVAKKLLAEAGYPNGFGVEMDCPNDRYVNDEAICQAIAAMLARIGVTIGRNVQPKAKYFAKVPRAKPSRPSRSSGIWKAAYGRRFETRTASQSRRSGKGCRRGGRWLERLSGLRSIYFFLARIIRMRNRIHLMRLYNDSEENQVASSLRVWLWIYLA